MSERMVTVQGIGKRFQLGGPRSFDPRDTLINNVRRMTRGGGETFWALRDVDFDVPKGEALGVIGRNGAGKSTLLKILSRITTPTEGRFTIEGRVSSLLEVGTGFHPELSGRENIFLNGTILGMKRQEVRRKYDEMVEFSGVERFIDTPVKHYSNGQRVRLAFAVAAHLEPEVLIVDEVLAVGDVEFQRKCLGKMKDVAGHGRTILFVSHNMSAISSLCHRCLLLEEGRVAAIGGPDQIISRYLHENNAISKGVRDLTQEKLANDGVCRLLQLRWTDPEGNTIDHASVTRPFGMEVRYEVLEHGHRPQPAIQLHASNGDLIFTTFPHQETDRPLAPGIYQYTCWFPRDLFNEDTYYATFWLTTWAPHKKHQVEENAMSISVIDDLGSPTHSPSYAATPGALRPLFKWTQEQ